MPSSCGGFIDRSCPCSLRWPRARWRARRPRPRPDASAGADRRAHEPRGRSGRPARHGRRRPPEDHLLVRGRADHRVRLDHPAGHARQEGPRRGDGVVSGLLKGGTYHARLVARNDDGLSLGADIAFTGAGLIPAVNVPALLPGSTARGRPLRPGSDPGTDPDAGSAPVLAPSAPPELGQTLGVAPQAGKVLVRLPGSTRAVTLTDAASIPVGTTLDARKGTVALSSALPGDDTQTGTFHGGLFEVRQPAGARGMTELVLRGLLPTCAGGAAPAPRPPRPSARRAGCGAATTMGASARAAATASPPSAAPRGTSRTAATAR